MDGALLPRVPNGWKAEWDANYQKWYYVNLHTKVSQWQEPVVAAEPLQQPGASLQALKPRNLPSGWEAEWDSNHKEWYYANVFTKQSQWEKPTESASPVLEILGQNVGSNTKQSRQQGPFELSGLSLEEQTHNTRVGMKYVSQKKPPESAQASYGTLTTVTSSEGMEASPRKPSISLVAMNEQTTDRNEKHSNALQHGGPSPQKLYQTLSGANHFRVLEIHPGSRDGPLSGTLLQPILSDQPLIYDALSYCWPKTDAKDHKIIEIDGLPFPIGPDLYAALVQFRQPKVPRNLWIDQICINQRDNDERISQIKIMADIYSKAKIVLIWLGEASDQSDIAMEFFPIFVELVRHIDEAARSRRFSLSPSDVIERRGKLAVALNHLFERPWFGRVWTLQEAALGKVAQVWCGTKSFSFQVLEDFESGCANDRHGHWASALGLIEPEFGTPDPENPYRSQLAHIRVVSVLKQATAGPVTILNTLRSLECSYDQDRILSVLRFFNTDLVKKITSDTDLAREITSKNDRFVADLYRRVAMSGLQRGELDYIGAAGLSQHCTSNAASRMTVNQPCRFLPSWGPDWTYRIRTHSYWVFNRDCLTKLNEPLFTAGGSVLSRNDWSFSENGMVLNATGIVVDEVKECTAPFRLVKALEGLSDLKAEFSTIKSAQEAYESYIASCMQLATRCSSNYGSVNIKRACRHSLVGGMMSDGSITTLTGVLVRATDEAIDSLFADFETSVWMVKENESLVALMHRELSGGASGLTAETKARMTKLTSTQERIGDFSKKNNLANAMAEACEGRRFFITNCKHYMGVAPDITEPGDKICVLPGCCAPLVIRPKGNRYRLIGECYVAGIMDGEIIESGLHSLQPIAFE